MEAGIASISESTAAARRIPQYRRRHRTIPDLPELDPPFSTIT